MLYLSVSFASNIKSKQQKAKDGGDESRATVRYGGAADLIASIDLTRRRVHQLAKDVLHFSQSQHHADALLFCREASGAVGANLDAVISEIIAIAGGGIRDGASNAASVVFDVVTEYSTKQHSQAAFSMGLAGYCRQRHRLGNLLAPSR